MTISPEYRNNLVLMYEGYALKSVGDNANREVACEITRCNIDGAFNALIRMEGAEAAAQYAFALSDRVVGRLREPTEWPVKSAPSPASLEAVAVALAAPTPKPAPMRFWSIFAVGWLCGFVMGAQR